MHTFNELLSNISILTSNQQNYFYPHSEKKTTNLIEKTLQFISEIN